MLPVLGALKVQNNLGFRSATRVPFHLCNKRSSKMLCGTKIWVRLMSNQIPTGQWFGTTTQIFYAVLTPAHCLCLQAYSPDHSQLRSKYRRLLYIVCHSVGRAERASPAAYRKGSLRIRSADAVTQRAIAEKGHCDTVQINTSSISPSLSEPHYRTAVVVFANGQEVNGRIKYARPPVAALPEE